MGIDDEPIAPQQRVQSAQAERGAVLRQLVQTLPHWRVVVLHGRIADHSAGHCEPASGASFAHLVGLLRPSEHRAALTRAYHSFPSASRSINLANVIRHDAFQPPVLAP